LAAGRKNTVRLVLAVAAGVVVCSSAVLASDSGNKAREGIVTRSDLLKPREIHAEEEGKRERSIGPKVHA